MGKFAVYSDSSCDIEKPVAKQNKINIIPLKVSFDRVNKLAEGVDISINEFYERLQNSSSVPKTHFPTVREYVKSFKVALEEGKDVLCLCLSSKLSMAYQCACNARDILSYAYKKNKVIIMDTLLAAGAQAALTLNAVKMRDANMSVEDTYRKLEELRNGAVTIFTVGSLEQLARGGRMSRATAAMGTLLHINPIIHMIEGELISREKAIGRAKAVRMIQQLALDSINKKTNDYEFTIFHSRSKDEAKGIEQDLKLSGARWFNPILEVGASIGSHTGASVLAINCMKRI